MQTQFTCTGGSDNEVYFMETFSVLGSHQASLYVSLNESDVKQGIKWVYELKEIGLNYQGVLIFSLGLVVFKIGHFFSYSVVQNVKNLDLNSVKDWI